MRGLYWEEWEVGAEFESPARTVTEADIVDVRRTVGRLQSAARQRGILQDDAFSAAASRTGRWSTPSRPGLLFQLHLYDDTLIAFLGFDNLKFTKPVKPGDTIHARIKVLEKRETSNADRGVMKRQLQVLNQRGEVVQEGVQAFLLKRKPA